MSQIKIIKRLYNTYGSFEVKDSEGNQCWITFEQAGQGEAIENIQFQNEYKAIPIEQGY